METQVKKREWVKTAAIIFLAVLLVLTFFSNTIMNRSLPEVATASVQSGTINAKIRGSGTVSANETYDVTLSQTRKIASVEVKVGQTVAAGDTLFTLEQQESDELKQAETDLATQKLAYQKSLLALSNTAAQSNHDVQKARNAYNDAVSVYNQYSTMDSSKLAAALAAAQVKLKSATQTSTDATQAYTDASTAKEYTDAQASVTEQQSAIKTLNDQIDAYQQQIADLGTTGGRTPTQISSEISGKQTELSQLEGQNASNIAQYEDDYLLLKKLAGDRGDVMYALCADTQTLATKLIDGGYDKDDASASAHAGAIVTAYNALDSYYDQVATINNKIAALQEELKSAQADETVEQSKAKLQRKLSDAQDQLDTAEKQLKKAQTAVSGYEDSLKRLKQAAADATAAVSSAQAEVDKLTSASTAADTVKSTKQALEDLVFAQTLGTSDSLDLQAARDSIAKQEKLVESLTQTADNVNVTAKVGGIVSAINVQAGGSIGANTALCTLNVTDRGYTIKISVTADQAKKVKVGDAADLVNYWGGDVTATLESIGNDPQNPGKGKQLVFRLTGDVTPDTNLTLSIGQQSANYDTLVPNAAIRTDNNGTFVLVVTSKSSPLGNRYTATRANVQVLAADDTNTAVSGLSMGDFVVTTSTKPIEAGTQVRLVENG